MARTLCKLNYKLNICIWTDQFKIKLFFVKAVNYRLHMSPCDIIILYY